MTLVERDNQGHGGSGTFTQQGGEVETGRWATAKRWNVQGPTHRVACSIGPVHYDDTGVWTPTADAQDLDCWPEVDLRPGISARQGVARTMYRCGYQVDLGSDYSLTVRRGGSDVTLTLLGLAWENAAGQRQVVGTPQPGRAAVADDDGLWVADALGPGLDYGVRLWGDMARPVVRIADPAALLAAVGTRPVIHTAGLRLCKLLGVSHAAGDLGVMRTAYRRRHSGQLRRGLADEQHFDPAAFPVRHALGDALWFQPPRAWDDEASYDVTASWQRFGGDVQASFGLSAEAVAGAAGALHLDATIAEQQVGASADDASERGATWPGYGTNQSEAATSHNIGAITTDFYSAGWRFSLPIPSGATVSSAYLSGRSGSTTSRSCPLRIYSEQADDPAAFGSGRYPGQLTRSTEYAAATMAATWSSSEWVLGSGLDDAMNIASPVQAKVARPGHTGGSHIVLICTRDGVSLPAVLEYRSLLTYDYSGNVSGAKLNATYTEAASGCPRHAMHYRRLRSR